MRCSKSASTGDDGSNVRVGSPGDDLIYGFNPAGSQGNVTSIAATRVAVVPGGAVFAVSPPGDTGRLFIGNLDGTVRILDLTTGQLLPDVFINIGSSIGVIGEGGLIGFAFDPNYASKWLFLRQRHQSKRRHRNPPLPGFGHRPEPC